MIEALLELLPYWIGFGFANLALTCFMIWRLKVLRSRLLFIGFSSVYFVLAFFITWNLVSTSQETTENRLRGMAPEFAVTLQAMGHDKLNHKTLSQSPEYLKLIDLEKEWLLHLPTITDVYTMKKDTKGRVYLMVDSETDYDQDGDFIDDREKRTEIGEIYDRSLPELESAFQGTPSFTKKKYQDRWGNWVSVFYPLKNAKGEVDGIVGIDFDAELYLSDLRESLVSSFLFFTLMYVLSSLLISAYFNQIQLREELSNALKLADVSQKAKTFFIANISHEIRTPVHAVLGMSRMLFDERPPLPSEEAKLKTIETSCDQLLDLLNNVIDVSKIESGVMTLHPTIFELKEALNDTCSILRNKIEEKGLRLIVQNQVPSQTWVSLDKSKIRQVLINLIHNAMKFTEQGKIEVSIRLEKKSRSAEFCVIEVSDTGPGIPAEKLGSLFKSFSRVEDINKLPTEGTGLGLAISRHIAEKSGGSLEVESKLNLGTTFNFQFPLERAPVTQEARAGTSGGTQLPHRSLLVVDDNPLNRMILKRDLQKLGLKAEEATNGMEAFVWAMKNPSSIIFMDCQMPILNGYSATQKIRKAESSEAPHKAYIVGVTANASEQERSFCLEAGMNNFMAKPFSTKEVASVLELAGQSFEWQKDTSTHSHLYSDEPQPSPQKSNPLLVLFQNDHELLMASIELYFSTAPEMEKRIEVSFASNDTREAAAALHAYKGALLIFDPDGVGTLISTAEKSAKLGDLEHAKKTYEEMQLPLQELKNLMQETFKVAAPARSAA